MKTLIVLIAYITILNSNIYGNQQTYDNIYALNFYDGVGYNSTIIPPKSKNMYLIADSMNALVFRETSLYYWPLTSEYKADWATRNTVVSGKLLIKSSNGQIQEIESQPYIIQYDMKDIPNTIAIYWGDEAFLMQQRFTKLQQAYNNAVYEYNIELQNYNNSVNALLQLSRTTGLSEEQLASFPVVPIPPDNLSIVSTEINIGFPLLLSEGKYTIWVEDENRTELRDSRKTLIMFTESLEAGGFKVFEENRWTVPVDFPDSKKTLFTTKSSTLYFQPYRYKQYERFAYETLVNPQQTTVRDQTQIWIPINQDIETKTLQLNGTEYSLSGFKVLQTAGSKLGYSILPLSTDDPDISFFGIKLKFGEAKQVNCLIT